MSQLNLEQLLVFYGELSPEQAYVYVRLDGGDSLSSARLKGQIVGPRSSLTRTLPATVTLQDLGPGPSKLARAVMPDPCFWAPGEPYLYDVHVQLVGRTKVLAETRRTLGLRMCGVRDHQLLWEARRWHVFGATESRVEAASWPAWRQSGLAKLLISPTDLQCEEASEEGVMLIAHTDAATPAGAEQEVRRLSRHAAVSIIALPAGGFPAEHVRALAPNMLFAQYCDDGDPIVPAAWADLLICRWKDPHASRHAWTDSRLPVLIQQSVDPPISLAQARDHCQRLADRLGPLEGLAGCLI